MSHPSVRFWIVAHALLASGLFGCDVLTSEYSPQPAEYPKPQPTPSQPDEATSFSPLDATNQPSVNAARLGENLLRYARDRQDPTALLAAVNMLWNVQDEARKPFTTTQLQEELLLLNANVMSKPNEIAESLDHLASKLEQQISTGQRSEERWRLVEWKHAAAPNTDMSALRETELAELLWNFGCSTRQQLAMLASIMMYVNDRPLPDESGDASRSGEICAVDATRVATIDDLLGSPAEAPHPAEPGRIDEIDAIEVNLAKLADYARGKLIDRRNRIEERRKFVRDWPTFLGPNRNGKTPERILTQWTGTSPDVVWHRPMGSGFGACAISQGRLFVFDRMESRRRLRCLDARTGEPRWEFGYAAPWDAPGGYLGPRCSPVVDNERVYIYDETGLLHCVCATDMEIIDSSGKKLAKKAGESLWSVNTATKYGVVPNQYGVSSTPRIAGNLIVVVVGGSDPEYQAFAGDRLRDVKPNGSGIVAFDKTTGKERYKVGQFLAAYASPQLMEIDGTKWGLAFLREGLAAFAPLDGNVEPIVGAVFDWRSEDSRAINAATPVVADNKNEVFISTAYGKGAALLQLESGKFKTVWSERASENRGLDAHFSTPVYQYGYLYGCSGETSANAELRCIDWKTGDVKWKKGGLGRVSLICADSESSQSEGGYLICLTENGELLVIKADPKEYVEVARADQILEAPATSGFVQPSLLNYPCWTAPVLSHGYLYLRGPDRLVCLDLTPTEAAQTGDEENGDIDATDQGLGPG